MSLEKPSNPTITARIHHKVVKAFTPLIYELRDESGRHKGHAGAGDGAGETHFHLKIVSTAFEGKSRLQRQRAVYQALDQELKERVHALSLELKTPEEAS
jgi:BolA protein